MSIIVSIHIYFFLAYPTSINSFGDGDDITDQPNSNQLTLPITPEQFFAGIAKNSRKNTSTNKKVQTNAINMPRRLIVDNQTYLVTPMGGNNHRPMVSRTKTSRPVAPKPKSRPILGTSKNKNKKKTTANTSNTTGNTSKITAKASKTTVNISKTAVNTSKTAVNASKTTGNTSKATANASKTTVKSIKSNKNKISTGVSHRKKQ